MVEKAYKKALVEIYFETNAKMVLINNDQCIIADIVLDVCLSLKKLNIPSKSAIFNNKTFV